MSDRWVDRLMGRHTDDRQTWEERHDKQIGRQMTDRWVDSQQTHETDRQRDRQMGRETDDRQTGRETYRVAHEQYNKYPLKE